MADLLVRDITAATGGRLQLAAMPARDGDLTMLRRSTAHAADVRPGDLYWALQGPGDDGMRHVEEAFARGAAGAVISSRSVEPWPGKFTLRVHDVRTALWQAASLARARFQGRVIAIASDETLSVGRLVHRVLGGSLSGSVGQGIALSHKSIVPSDVPALAMLNAHPSHDYLVLGLSSRIDSTVLAQRCCPHLCVVTSACDAVESLDALPEDGWAILNGDDAGLRSAARVYEQTTRVIWFGRGVQNDLVARNVAATDDVLRLTVDGVEINVPQGELADLPAILAAIALGKILYISDLPVLAAIGNVPKSMSDVRWQMAEEKHSHLPSAISHLTS